MKAIHKIQIYACLLLLLFSCKEKQTDSLMQALTIAGENRFELGKVLAHYRENPADSLKYKAAVFLIENMPKHYYIRKDAELYGLMDSLNRSALKNKEVYAQFDSIKPGIEVSPVAVFADIETLSADFLIRHIDGSFENRQNGLWKDKLSFENFCEYILPYPVSSEKREFWIDYYRNRYLPYLEPYMRKPDSVENLVDVCDRITEELIKSTGGIVLYHKGLNLYPPLMVDHLRSGHCDDYVARTIYLMRSLGIPVGRDFSPQWNSYYMPHSWNTVLSGDGKHHPFTGFEATTKQWLQQWEIDKTYHACPKVYRYSRKGRTYLYLRKRQTSVLVTI
jgi:hypothetical protein